MLALVFLGLFVVSFGQATRGMHTTITNGIYGNIPPLTAVDAYAPCLRTRGDTYCYVSAKLIGDASHPLYNFLVQYSSDRHKHFNRTNIHRGICLKNCQEFLEISPNVTIVLEACLNDTMSKEYGLSTNLFRTLCSEYSEGLQLDASDFAFGAVLLAVLLLNLLGSLYDFCDGHDTTVGRIFLCFSVKRNWQRLMAPMSGPNRLLGLSGYRVVLVILVIFAHVGVIAFHALDNPEFIEEPYDNVLLMLLHRSAELLQVFFVISALLLVYKVMTSEEHYDYNRGNLHKALFRRWLRFTPIYAMVLFFVCTWSRHIGEGPFWKATMEVEANDCRRNWWLHLLYLSNYIDHSRCMIHTWSLAVELQFTALGLTIFSTLKEHRSRMAAVALVLTAGLITPAAAIFLQNVEPVIIFSPEVILNWCSHDPTFNNLYKRAHTNLVSYCLGLALGYVIYNLKETDLDAEKYKIFRVVHWLLMPGAIVLQLTGSVFYYPEVEVPLLVRLFYTSAIKLATGLLMGFHVYLTVVKADGLGTTRILKWRLWAPLGRLSYCVYMLHVVVLRIRAGSLDTVYHMSVYTHIQHFLEGTILSFLVALPLFLFVESPAAELTRMFLVPSQDKKHVD